MISGKWGKYIQFFVGVLLFSCQSLKAEESGMDSYLKYITDEDGKWAVGTGMIVRNSPFRSESTTFLPVPIVDYDSKNLFIREMKAGYHFKKVDDPYKGGFFFDTFLSARLRPGSARRKFSIDAGAQGGYQHPIGAISLSVMRDITAKSGGVEAALAYSFTFLTKDKQHVIIPRLTVTWQNNQMANYMWGVDETITTRQAEMQETIIYSPYTIEGNVMNFSAGIAHIWNIDNHWRTFAGAQISKLDGKILENPAIERDLDYAFMMGVLYRF